MIIAVVTTASTVASAHETVRAALAVYPGCRCEVLDLDGGYLPRAGESVHMTSDVDLTLGLSRLALDDQTFLTSMTALWSAHLLEGEPVLGLVAGVILLRAPTWSDDPDATVVVTRAIEPPSSIESDTSIFANELFVLGTGAVPRLAELRNLARDWRTASRWLDLFFARVPHTIVTDDAALVSRFNSDAGTVLEVNDSHLARAGRPVIALDLVGFDPKREWLFDSRRGPSSGPLLDENPALASFVSGVASREREDLGEPHRVRPDADLLRQIVRDATPGGEKLDTALEHVEDWLIELVPSGERMPVARYLLGIRNSRTDLVFAYPRVPGADAAGLARWALEHGVHEALYDPVLLERAASATAAAQPANQKKTRAGGVNLVGYLSGELGIGTSARLMDAALQAAEIPTSTFAASAHLQSRAAAPYRRSEDVRYDTTLLAVNADQTETVSDLLSDVIENTYRIGMWYWEVEEFPASRHGAFAHVDEVWVATDFIRAAIAQHATVPVRTVMPPLPQRTMPEPPPVPARLGIPSDRPWFFFAFDYLSTVERKNPAGLLEAFRRAYPEPGPDGPMLVIKTLNARRRPTEAAQLRSLAAHRPDVLLIDEYLESDELTALAAGCTAFVSLHRAEGLGLSIAEAMAWGRPVVVSAYSGNMAFTNSENAFLVACAMVPIPEGAEPYPAGTPWAEPDLDAAAAFLRQIIEDPDRAAAVGRRAAEDIRLRHAPSVAAIEVREALELAWRRKAGVLARARVTRLRRGAWNIARSAAALVRGR